MRKVTAILALLSLLVIASPALATTNLDAFKTADGLPQLPLMEALAEIEAPQLASGACAVIRPVQTHSDCNFFLCESHGCGAPYHFDPIDCACYCGNAF